MKRVGPQRKKEVDFMDEKKIKEILGQQLELLAEVSKSKPKNLMELSLAMCELADRLEEARDPISH